MDWLQSIITGDVRANALKNTQAGLSTTARLQKSHEQQVEQLQDLLASRGLLRSGALGVGLNQEQQQFTQGQYDARTKLLQFLMGVQQAFLQNQRSLQSNVSNDLNAQIPGLISSNPTIPATPGTQVPQIPGNPFYAPTGTQGIFYNPQGQQVNTNTLLRGY